MSSTRRLATSDPSESFSPSKTVIRELHNTDSGRSDVRAVIFPEPGELRSRRVVSRSNSRSAGKFPSWKMKRMLHWESIHELNAFRLLDCDPDVTCFSEQPCQIV